MMFYTIEESPLEYQQSGTGILLLPTIIAHFATAAAFRVLEHAAKSLQLRNNQRGFSGKLLATILFHGDAGLSFLSPASP